MSKRRRQRAVKGRGSPLSLYVLGGLVAAVAIAIVIIIAATSSSETAAGPIVAPGARPADVPQDGKVYGDPNAPVTIDEYLDYQCPFCKRAADLIFPEIGERYVETGIAKLVIHPIAILGEESVQAAAGAECALAQDAFLAYHDALVANQGRENAGAFSDDRLKEMASAAGLDTAAFGACLDSGRYRDAVGANTRAASAIGITSTPTFLVNGERVQTSVDAISAAIERALQGD